MVVVVVFDEPLLPQTGDEQDADRRDAEEDGAPGER